MAAWRLGSRILPVVPSLMLSGAPDMEKSFDNLYHNGQMLVLAGTNITGPTLAVVFCYLLGQLPYLSAVIQEGLRTANGTSTRAPRIDPQQPTMFIDRSRNVGIEYSIPPGTPMSMTSMHVHQKSPDLPRALQLHT